MKLLKLLFLLLLFAAPVYSQGVRYDNFVVKPLPAGGLQAVSGALITVCTSAGSGTPCTPKVANIYSDEALTTPITGTGGTGTTNSDSFGNYGFYIAPGDYVITITGSGITSSTVKVTLPCGVATGCTLSSLTVSGTTTLANLNNTLYVSQFAGADLGAKMNAAVTQCTVTLALPACRYVVDTNGTISTTPNFTQGSIVEFYPLLYTLSTTFPINHNNTTWFFNGARFNYNQDAGNAAFLVGKNATGTVNTQNAATGGCAANCVTFATGTNFANIDAGDKIIIANSTFNVSSVQSSTVLTVESAPGTQAGAAYAAQLNPTSSGFSSVTVRDLTVGYTGAGTNASNTAFKVENVTTGYFDNIYLNGYSSGFGLRALGSVSNVYVNVRQTSNKNAIILDQFVGGGSTIPSNANLFIHPVVLASPAGGNPVLITNNSINNILQFGDFEVNAATVMGTINLGAASNQILWSDHERNGDSTTSSADWAVSAPGNIFLGNRFTSAGANQPAAGILANAGATATRIDNNKWVSGAPYTNSWVFAAGVTGTLINNTGVIGVLGHTDPVGFVMNENGAFGGAVMTGAVIGDAPAVPNGNCLRGAVAANNSTFCLIGPNASNEVALDPGGNGTRTTGSMTVGANGNQALSAGTLSLVEATPPGGASGRDIFSGDSVTHTPSWNNNNNGTSSPTGAWQCTNVTPVTVNANVATDQNLMACTIPAGTLNRVGRTLRIAKAKGIYSTPAASTSQVTLKAKLCTVSGCGSGVVITPISIQSTALGTVQITNDNFSLRGEITTQTAGASSAFEPSGEFLIDLSTLTTAADSEFGDTNTATVGSIDSTAQLFLQITIAFSNASASNSATQRQLILETVN